MWTWLDQGFFGSVAHPMNPRKTKQYAEDVHVCIKHHSMFASMRCSTILGSKSLKTPNVQLGSFFFFSPRVCLKVLWQTFLAGMSPATCLSFPEICQQLSVFPEFRAEHQGTVAGPLGRSRFFFLAYVPWCAMAAAGSRGLSARQGQLASGKMWEKRD